MANKIGTNANESLTGSAADDYISGLGGDDNLLGGLGNDRIYGGDGKDSIFAGGGSDSVYAGLGDDWIVVSRAAVGQATPDYVYVDGGDGLDRLTLGVIRDTAPAPDGIRIDLTAGTGTLISWLANAPNVEVKITGIEDIDASSASDIIKGDDHRNTFFDARYVSASIDRLDGGAGSDRYVASKLDYDFFKPIPTNAVPSAVNTPYTFEIAYGARAVDLAAMGGLPAGELNSGDGVALYTLWKDANNNNQVDNGEITQAMSVLTSIEEYVGTVRADKMTGSAKDEVFEGGLGANTIDGGAGYDFVSYEGLDILSAGYMLRVSSSTFYPNGATIIGPDGLPVPNASLVDTLQGIEGVIGSRNGDEINVGASATSAIFGAVGSKVFAMAGDDVVTGNTTNDTLDGGDGNDILIGDILSVSGVTGDHSFNPISHTYTLINRDVLIGGKGADVIDGGAGSMDVSSYRDSAAAVQVDLLRGEGFSTDAMSDSTGDVLININAVVGSRYNDIIRGNQNGNVIEGRDGSDTIQACDGDDVIWGEADPNSPVPLGTGDLRPWTEKSMEICGPECDPSIPYGMIYEAKFNDELHGECGNDLIFGQAGDDVLFGDQDNDTLDGGDGVDCLMGGTGDDSLLGGKSTDVLQGEDGNDTLNGGPGFDFLLGGSGMDTADYSSSSAGVTIKLDKWWQNSGGDAAESSISGFLELLGGGMSCVDAVSDGVFLSVLSALGTENGSTDAFTFRIPDVIVDVENAVGSQLDDIISGDAASNMLTGLGGNDQLFGGLGDDTLIGGPGSDTLDGGGGFDRATFSGLKASYTVSQGNGVTTVAGGNGSDTLRNVEYLKFDDKIAGDIDGDGFSNLLWLHDSGLLRQWSVRGNAAVSDTSVTDGGNAQFGTDWHVRATGDYNGDGKADLLWQADDGRVRTWLMDGAEVTADQNVTPAPITPNWHVIGSGDFNGDRTDDLLWRSSEGQVRVWTMKDGLILKDQKLADVPIDWHVAGTGDFDGDGVADLVWRADDGRVRLWEIKDAAPKADLALGPGAVPTNWTIEATGDYSGDGRADLVWRSTDGRVREWTMNGSEVTKDQGLESGVPASWHVAESGTFAGTASADLIWRDESGDTRVWLLGPDGVTADLHLANVSPSWHLVGQTFDLV